MMIRFNFKTLTAIKTPAETNRIWQKRLSIAAMALGSLAAVTIGTAVINDATSLPGPPPVKAQANQANPIHVLQNMLGQEISRNDVVVIPSSTSDALQPVNRPVMDVDPADSSWVSAHPQMRNAFASTVMLLSMDRNGHLFLAGSGTILADHEIGGLPVIVSVRHVTDLAKSGNATGYLLAVNRHGVILGHIQQLPQYGNDSVDYTTLSYFDTAHPVDRKALQAIRGVTIAQQLPVGLQIGPSLNDVINPGASGGGWYNADGQLVGVIAGDGINPGDAAQSSALAAVSPLNIMDGRTARKQVWLPIFGMDYVQTLASGQALRQLEHLAGGSQHEVTADTVTGGFGFGFPAEIPMFFQSDLAYDPGNSPRIAAELNTELSQDAAEAGAQPAA